LHAKAFRNLFLPLSLIIGAGSCNLAGPDGPLPDLTVLQVTAPGGGLPLSRTDPLAPLGARVQNTGALEAGAFTLEYRLSADAVLDGGDLLVASTPVPGLGAGETFDDTVTSPPSAFDLGGGPGTSYILVTVDANSQVAETSEANNTRSAAIALKYDHVIIDTYGPLESKFILGDTSALYSNVMELFGPVGDTSTPPGYDLWTNFPASTAIASDNGQSGQSGRPADNPYYDYAYIDCAADLAPGDYYLRVRLLNQSPSPDNLYYALRVITEPDNTYTGWWFATENTSDASDAPVTGGWGVPSSFQSVVLGGKLNRYLPVDGVHWVRITLP
jgi:hypothetical protein